MAQEPKRILQVVTYMGRGGIETMLMNYYRHMDRAKVQFDFLVHRDFRADFDDEIESLGGRIYRVPPMNPLSGTYRTALRDFFRNHTYEIVHCHLNYKSGIVLAAAKQAGVPVRIAHAHTASMSAGWQKAARILMKPLIPPTATEMIACGEAAGKAVFSGHPFSLLPNAITAGQFRFRRDVRENQRASLGLGDSFTIMHVGRFSEEKNHAFLIRCFSQVIQEAPSAKLVLVGDGALRGEVETLVRDILPADSVRFLGVRNDIPTLLQAADIFLLPSVFEGLPVTLIEAQAAGLPCIKSDTITDECIVTDLVTSLPIDDPNLWAREILKKRGLPRLDQHDAIVKSGYDITTAAKKLENFYLNGEPL